MIKLTPPQPVPQEQKQKQKQIKILPEGKTYRTRNKGKKQAKPKLTVSWESTNDKLERRQSYALHKDHCEKDVRRENIKLRKKVDMLTEKVSKLSTHVGRFKPEGDTPEGFKTLYQLCRDKWYDLFDQDRYIDNGNPENVNLPYKQGILKEFQGLYDVALQLPMRGSISKEKIGEIFLRSLGYLSAISVAESTSDFSKITVGILSQYLTASNLEMLQKKWSSIEPQGLSLPDLRVKLGSLKSVLSSIEDIPCFRIIQQGLSLLVFSGLRPSRFLIENSSLEKIVQTAEERISNSPFDIVLTFLSLSETMLELFEVYSLGGSMIQILLPTSIHQRIAEIKARKMSVLQGTYFDLYKRDPIEYEHEVNKLSRELSFELRRKDIPPRLKVVYEQYYTQIIKIQQDLDIMNQAVRVREAPCTLMIYGPSNIGKTTVSDDAVDLFGRVTGIDVSDTKRWAMSERDKFDSMYKQDKTVITIDDMANMKPDKMQPNEMAVARTIDIINNATKFSIQAEAEDKGRIQFKPKLVVASSNVEHLNASYVSCEPYSILRRWLYMEVRVKVEFSVNGEGKELDKVKANSYSGEVQPPLNEGRLFRWMRRDSGRLERVYLEGDCGFRCVSELYPKLAQIWIQERLEQKAFVDRTLKKSSIKYCTKCYNPKDERWCHCVEPSSNVPHFKAGVSEILDEEFRKITIDEMPRTVFWYNFISPATLEAYRTNKRIPLTQQQKDEIVAIRENIRTIYDIWTTTVSQLNPSYSTALKAYYLDVMKEPEDLEPEADILSNFIAETIHSKLILWGASLPVIPSFSKIGMWLWRITLTGYIDMVKHDRYQHASRMSVVVSLICLCKQFGISFNFVDQIDYFLLLAFHIGLRFIGKFINVGGFLVMSYVSLFYALAIVLVQLLGRDIAFIIITTISTLLYYSGFATFAQIVVCREVRRARTFKDLRLYEGILSCATVLFAISVLRNCWNTFQRFSDEGNLMPTKKEEIEERHAEKNDWLTPEIIPLKAIHEVKSMTHDQVLKRLGVSLVRFEAYEQDKLVARGAAQLVSAQCLMIPNHVWVKLSHLESILRIDIDRRPGYLTAKTKGTVIEKSYVIPGSDFTLLRLSKNFSVVDITKFMTNDFPKFEMAATLYIRRDDGIDRFQDVVYVPNYSINNVVHKDRGGSYYMTDPTIKGDCMSPVVCKTSPCVIIGFHCGGNSSSTGASFFLEKQQLEDALNAISDYSPEGEGDACDDLRRFRTRISFVGIDDVSPLSGEPCFTIEPELHPRSVVNYVHQTEEYSNPPSCEIGGYCNSFRVTPHSQVLITQLSPFLEMAGVPRIFGKPEFRSDRNHADYFQIGVIGMSDVLDSELNTCMVDYTAGVLTAWRQLEIDRCEPLTISETINGVKGNRWIKQLREHTSAGVGLPGNKVAYMKVEYLEDGSKFFVLNPDIIASVADGLEKLRRGLLISPPVKTALKDEPTKLKQFNDGKSKVRVFSVFPFSHFLIGKMLFAPILARLYDVPLASEMLQGCNVTTEDWHQIHTHLIEFSPACIIEGDFSKFDVNLSGQIIRAVGTVFGCFASNLGYSIPDQIAVMTYVSDVAMNPWLYNGSVFILDKWNPSGNYLTIAINGIANSLLHRLAYYHIGKSFKNTASYFRDVVHLGTVGDDSLGSTLCPWYNMVNLSKYFQQLNIKYTSGDKSSEIVPFQERKLASLCKRSFRYEPRVDKFVAPLKLESIWKMLHCRMVSPMDEDTLARGNLLVALRELARHTEETYVDGVGRISLALALAKKEYLLPEVSRSHSEWWDILKDDFPSIGIDEDVSLSSAEVLLLVEPEGMVRKNQQMQIPANDIPRCIGYRRRALMVLFLLGLHLSVLFLWFQPTNPLVVSETIPWITENENKISTPKNETMGGVVELMNEIAPWQVSMPVTNEDTMKYGLEHVSNDSILERPIKILETQWLVATSFNTLIDPWTLFFTDPLVANRIAHYKYVRGDLKLTFVVNGNAFYYGRAVANYIPLAPEDRISFADNDNFARIQAMQRPHIMMNPTDCQGGDLVLPFIYPLNAVNILESHWNELGYLHMFSLNDLLHANGSSNPVTITVFASLQNYSLTGPTAATNPTIQPQGDVMSDEKDEYGKISGPAHTIANWSGKLANAPYIGVYARATQMIASAVAGVAGLFGFCRPTDLQHMPMLLRTTMNYANSNVQDLTRSLAIDCKKEITVDPRVVGGDPIDHMALIPLAMRESFVTSFGWSPANTVDTVLHSQYVSPLQGFAGTGSSPRSVAFTPSAWVAFPFAYWTGSMDFRFQIVASKYHRGRLRIAWDPAYFKTGDPSYNVNYAKIVDISETSDLTFRVKWGQNRNYAVVHNHETTTFEFPSFVTGNITTPLQSPRCNGIIQVSVVNALTTPQGSSDPVYVNVYTKMCEDFEVCQPSDYGRSRIIDLIINPGFTPPGVATGPAPLRGTPTIIAPIPTPLVAAPVPPFDTLTTTPNGLLMPYHGLNTPQNISPEWSTTIGVSLANKGSQLWAGSVFPSSSEYTLTYYTDGKDTTPISIKFSNPTTTPVDITIDFSPSGGASATGTLIGTIGATLTLTVPAIPKVVNGMARFIGTLSANVRPLVIEVTTKVPAGTSVKMIEGSTWNNLNPTGNFTVSGTDLNVTGDVSFSPPGDWVVGTRMQPVSPYTLTMGTGGNRITFRTRSSPPVNNGMAMGSYSPTMKYNASNGSPTGLITFVARDAAGVPELRVISRMFYLGTTSGSTAPPGPAVLGFSAQGEVMQEESIGEDKNCPIGCPPDTYLGPTTVVGPANQVYFGEQISSWRQVLKRYQTVIHCTLAAVNTFYQWDVPSIPYSNGSFGSYDVKASGNTMILYITNAYVAMRGSGRYSYTESFTASTNQSSIAFHARDAIRFNPTQTAGTGPALGPRWSGSTFDNPIQGGGANVEIPWYSNRRFINPRSRLTRTNVTVRPCATIVAVSVVAQVKNIAWSAGEDFSLAMFLCTPIVQIALGS